MSSSLYRIYKSAAIYCRYGMSWFRYTHNIRPGLLRKKLEKSANELFKIRLTSTGMSVILCMVVLFGLNLSLAVFPVLSLLSFIFYLSLTLSILCRPRMKVICSLPNWVTVGEEIDITVRVKNRSSIPAFEIFAGILPLPDGFKVVSFDIVSYLKAGEKAEIHLKLLPLRRGVYRLSVPSCYSLFPFHLFRSGRICRDRRTLIVQPKYFPIEALDIPMIKTYQGSCTKLNSQTGDSLEYIGNREYRYGDALKNIDMKAWARTGHPVVREFGQEYYSNVGVILDNYVAAGKKNEKPSLACLEASISITASIIDRLCHDEHLITFFAADKRCWNFHSIRNITVLHKVLEELAVIKEAASSDLDGLIANIIEHINRLSIVIFILSHLDEQRIAIIESIKQMGCKVKVIVISEGSRGNLPDQMRRDINIIPHRQITQGTLKRL